MKHIYLIAILLMKGISCFSTVWQVGPSQTYTMPSQVSGLVGNGDTVDIDAGVYFQDVCGWYANNLLLRCSNGMAHMKANFTGYQGKAIWVIGGNNVKVSHIEFSECAVPSQNGAGIRQEGMDLTVENCYFHDNENGILAGTVANSTIIIRDTEFARNGFGDGLTHNLYINNIDTLIFEHNYSHHANIGHELKSRAHVNIIRYSRFSNEATGNASREIDLPNGGLAFLIGNVIHQGPNGTNGNMVGYGLEGLNNPTPHELFMVNNTLVNERPTGSFLQFNSGTAFFKGYNNIFSGIGNYVSGSFPVSIDTLDNWRVTSLTAPLFQNYSVYDYHILNPSSAAIFNGTLAGTAYSLSLDPTFEYAFPGSILPRCLVSDPTLGAFEYCLVGIDPETVINPPLYCASAGLLTLLTGIEDLMIYDLRGALLVHRAKTLTGESIPMPRGLYIVSSQHGRVKVFIP
ncbi:MAG: right-handed parallel beta-helix repeat-containing protein [Bacteroidia bacterium]|nr:right-handed parallel beta-helix repeat-containing protein [Bacteroidia bacterium]